MGENQRPVHPTDQWNAAARNQRCYLYPEPPMPLTKDGTSAKEIQIRIASATAAMTRLNVIWKSNLNFSTKFRLYNSLVVSILLYGCQTWTLLAESERRIQAFETKCLRKLLRILYTDRKTNDYVRETVGDLVGPYEPLLSTVKRRKLAWFGHVTRHDSISKVILQGTVEGGRRRGRQRRNWSDNVKDWTGLDMPDLLATAANRSEWRTMSASTVMSPRRLQSHGTE
ncbi:endonuclease-reverse transcriptase [Apostichopus japonicus]|uniref:Endonuclease-reverse transcriptase n=1 Tax=Stichopus japonicus TaxID=307972 RepID=A0A2G8L4W3_STIJA|nr:endonuclease-reverse transcriptase [Apostichopus japonicus]